MPGMAGFPAPPLPPGRLTKKQRRQVWRRIGKPDDLAPGADAVKCVAPPELGFCSSNALASCRCYVCDVAPSS